jgi:hypothetical protein
MWLEWVQGAFVTIKRRRRPEGFHRDRQHTIPGLSTKRPPADAGAAGHYDLNDAVEAVLIASDDNTRLWIVSFKPLDEF